MRHAPEKIKNIRIIRRILRAARAASRAGQPAARHAYMQAARIVRDTPREHLLFPRD